MRGERGEGRGERREDRGQRTEKRGERRESIDAKVMKPGDECDIVKSGDERKGL